MTDDRQALERRKLELEITELQRKVRYTTGTFVLSIVGVVIALGGVLGQNYLAEIKSEKANLTVAQAQASLKTLNDEKAKTTAEIEKLRVDAVQLQERNVALGKATDALIAVAQTAPSSQQTDTAIKATENAKYWVGLYTLGLAQAEYEKLASFLSQRGYAVGRGAPLDTRPAWLSKQSSVLYYAPESREKAQQIAKELEQATGQQFAVAQGAGLGVIPGQERTTFFVHYVAPPKA
jgi:cell division protein FtsB